MKTRVLLIVGLWLTILGQAFAQNLQIDYLDVGQGDAVLIRTPDGKTMLYDAGRKTDDVADQLAQLGVTKLDLVIMSHADANHIGGMAEVVSRFKPANFMTNGIAATTQVYERVLAALAAVRSQGLQATERVISLGSQTKLQILPPERKNTDQNENSVGVVLSFAGFRMVMTGDAEPDSFAFWLRKYAPLLASVDVYKASHHGSKNNDTKPWLETLKAQDIIISTGKDNSYGHPAPEAIALYRAVGAAIWRTDEDGRVSLTITPNGRYTLRTSTRPREVTRTTRAGLSASTTPKPPASNPNTPAPSPTNPPVGSSVPGLLGTVTAFGGTL
jgi:competence protein ComEC